MEPAGEGEGSAGSILLLVAETARGVWRLVGCPLLGRTDRAWIETFGSVVNIAGLKLNNASA